MAVGRGHCHAGDSGRNNPFDWVRSANQAATVDCVAILASRAAASTHY
jgi:hypothetical protein